MDLRNEVAGITFFVGIAALFVTLVGVALFLSGLLPLTVGNLVPAALGGGGVVASGLGLVLFGAALTTVGIVGLVAVWGAITSGYFDRETRERAPPRDPPVGESTADSPARESTAENSADEGSAGAA